MTRLFSQKHGFIRSCSLLVSIYFCGCDKGTTIRLCADCPVSSPSRSASVTALTIPQGTVSAGHSVPFTVTVSPSNATGTVTITDITDVHVSNPAPQGNGALASGSTVISLRPINAGTRVYRADYSGDPSYSPSQITTTVAVTTPLTASSCGVGDAVYVLQSGFAAPAQTNFTSSVVDETAVCAQNNGTVLTLSSPNIVKSASGIYQQFDPTGIDAGVLAYGSSADFLSGATINLEGAPRVSAFNSTYALFASGSGATINVSNGSITAANSYAAAGVGNNGTLNISDSSITVDGVPLLITEGGVLAISNTTISSSRYSLQIILQALPSELAKMAHLRIVGGSIASPVPGTFPALPIFAISGNQTADVYLSRVDLSLLTTTSTQTLLALTDNGKVALTLDHQTARGIVQANSESSLTLVNGSSLDGDFLGGSVTLDASSSLILHSSNGWQTFNDPGGIQGTQVVNVTYGGHLSYPAVLNPQLGGLTYSLQGGGTLSPY